MRSKLKILAQNKNLKFKLKPKQPFFTKKLKITKKHDFTSINIL